MDWHTAELGDPERALCAFAEKLTKSPQKMSRTDIESLRNHGFGDDAIHDATQVIAYFNYINRVADALGVDQESFVNAWELPYAE